MSIKKALKLFEKFANKQKFIIEDKALFQKMDSQKYREELESIKAEIKMIEDEIDAALLKLERI